MKLLNRFDDEQVVDDEQSVFKNKLHCSNTMLVIGNQRQRSFCICFDK
ncbi:hypothetical protein Hanom_Chr10g00961661 [Helianthus anomalus]